jgi:hypothetical protein
VTWTPLTEHHGNGIPPEALGHRVEVTLADNLGAPPAFAATRIITPIASGIAWEWADRPSDAPRVVAYRIETPDEVEP